MTNSIEYLLQDNPLVPVFTFNQGDNVEQFADYLLEQKVSCIEITLRTPEGFQAIELLKKNSPNLIVGAGTVVNPEQVNRLVDMGADFMVSPGITKSLINSFTKSEVPFLCGISTPSEVISAMEEGIHSLKFFPAEINGGVPVLKMYGQLFPEVRFCPTGGISAATSANYLALENVFAVGGSWFQKDYKNSI